MTNKPKYLTEHFAPNDATDSQAAERNNLNNEPPDQLTWDVISAVAVKMEKVRALLGNFPVNVSSWYRSPAVNVAVGSKSLNSQHLVGEAVDFTCHKFGDPVLVVKTLAANKELIGFDQLILEHSWVHISFAILTRKPRGQVLSLLSTGGYAQGITDKSGKPL